MKEEVMVSVVHPLAIKVMAEIDFDDPDAFTGLEEQVLEEFRRVRDEIRNELSKLDIMETPQASLRL